MVPRSTLASEVYRDHWKEVITMSLDNTDAMEWLTSDVITITRRYLAMYRKNEDDPDPDPDRILIRYCESVRELLDAAMEGSGRLDMAEHDLSIET